MSREFLLSLQGEAGQWNSRELGVFFVCGIGCVENIVPDDAFGVAEPYAFILTWISQRLQIGPAMISLIAAEWLVADAGFGYRLRLQGRIFHFDVVYTYLIVLGVTGLLIDWALSLTRRKLCPWFGD